MDHARVAVEQLDTHAFPQNVFLSRERSNFVRGWSFAADFSLEDERLASYLLLRARGGDRLFFAPLFQRIRRDDVASAFPEAPDACTRHAGFTVSVRLSAVPPGEYEFGVIRANATQVVFGFEPDVVTVR